MGGEFHATHHIRSAQLSTVTVSTIWSTILLTWWTKENQNVARPIVAKFVFHFLDGLGIRLSKEKIGRRFLFIR